MKEVMMVCVVMDDVANSVVGSVLLFKSEALAKRLFEELAADPQSFVFKHPQDYRMVHSGSLELVSGKLSCLKTPRTLFTGKSVVSGSKKNGVA